MIPLWVVQKIEHVLTACPDGSITLHLAQGRVQKIETVEWTREQKEKETRVLVA